MIGMKLDGEGVSSWVAKVSAAILFSFLCAVDVTFEGPSGRSFAASQQKIVNTASVFIMLPTF